MLPRTGAGNRLGRRRSRWRRPAIDVTIPELLPDMRRLAIRANPESITLRPSVIAG